MQEAEIGASVANTFVDTATIHEKISTILLGHVYYYTYFKGFILTIMMYTYSTNSCNIYHDMFSFIWFTY